MATRPRLLDLVTATLTVAALLVAGVMRAEVPAVLLAWTLGTPAALTLARALRPARSPGWLGRVRRLSGAVGWAMALPLIGMVSVDGLRELVPTLQPVVHGGAMGGLTISVYCGVPALAALSVGLAAALVALVLRGVDYMGDSSGLAPHHG